MAQSRIVAEALRSCHPHLEVELVPIVTRGDGTAGELGAVGGKGLFTAELEEALRAGTIDLAVHSAKDLPAVMAQDLAVVAVPARADPRDALVSRAGWTLAQLPEGARVGTGSVRRREQLRAIRGDLRIVPLRGNVDSRLRKALADERADAERLDAVVLAMAGMLRSGLAEKHADNIQPLDVDDFIPAAGQGALAVQAAADNGEIAELVSHIDDAGSHQALLAERRVLRVLGADCHSCVAVHIAPEGGGWCGYAAAARPDGGGMVRLRVMGDSAEMAAEELVRGLRGTCGLDSQPELR